MGEIKVSLKENIIRISVGSIPCGFFTGIFNSWSGLFYRSPSEITYLGPEEYCNIICWRYPIDCKDQAVVTDYKKVNVEIIVK